MINELPLFINLINTNPEQNRETNQIAALDIITSLSKLNRVEELIKHVSR